MQKRYLVVGAGINGLAMADALSAAGHDVTVVEQNSAVGGLSQTNSFGEFVFDTGPHWIFINDDEIRAFMDNLFEDGVLYPNKLRPGVFFLDKYYKWPLTLEVITKLPFSVMAKALRDMLVLPFVSKKNIGNYRELMLAKFGKTLYDLDFGPYTEKFTKTPLNQLHTDWSKIGINRSVDEKPALDSLFSIIAKTIAPKKTSYGYYLNEGISGIATRLQKRILKNGGTIHLNTTVTDLHVVHGAIESAVLSNSSLLPVDHVVWTGDPNSISAMILGQQFEFNFLTNVFFNVMVRGNQYPDYQWLYYVDENIIFNRLYNTVEFSKSHAPEGCFGYCAEVTCRAGEAVEKDPEQFIGRVKEDLVKTRALRSIEDVIDVVPVVKKQAYPLYTLTYRKELAQCLNALYSACRNLSMTGRTGTFWYNNIDHTIANALAEAQLLLNGKRGTLHIET